MNKGIEIRNISKAFGNTKALDDVSIEFNSNRIYGLLGRNGAGKSTLLNIITNRIFADKGEVYVDGEPAKENDRALSKIYLMGEKNNYPENMKIKDIFKWSKEFYPDFDEEYAYKLAEKFKLDTKKTIKKLSTGYASIAKIIIALSVNVPYIFLDEPVLGLDANHRDMFYKILIQKYIDNPCTIIVSTHLIEEVSNVIEEIVIINDGKVIRNEATEDLLSKGYTVTGSSTKVDEFVADKKVIGEDVIGGLKAAYVLGDRPEKTPEGIEITKLDLQKLFIQLTNM